MERFVCPPWFQCRCLLGIAISRTTMLSHRRRANQKRVDLGLGPFRLGRKVANGSTDIYNFECMDSLIDHLSDNEDVQGPVLPPGIHHPHTHAEDLLGVGEYAVNVLSLARNLLVSPRESTISSKGVLVPWRNTASYGGSPNVHTILERTENLGDARAIPLNGSESPFCKDGNNLHVSTNSTRSGPDINHPTLPSLSESISEHYLKLAIRISSYLMMTPLMDMTTTTLTKT